MAFPTHNNDEDPQIEPKFIEENLKEADNAIDLLKNINDGSESNMIQKAENEDQNSRDEAENEESIRKVNDEKIEKIEKSEKIKYSSYSIQTFLTYLINYQRKILILYFVLF